MSTGFIKASSRANNREHRILSPDGIILERASRNVWRAVEQGETGITVIPNGYDWENSVELKISVVR